MLSNSIEILLRQSNLIIELLKTPAFLVGALSLIVGFFTYLVHLHNLKLKHAEWLFSLYKQFYEESHYKHIRYILDYKPKEEFAKLQKALKDDAPDYIAEELVDYLNFFEFVATLWKIKQLTLKEVLYLFEYYLENVRSTPDIHSYVQTQGFESLSMLIDKIRSSIQKI